ncbi:MAG TPA: response regulator [Burkholderiales bacterium]|nr:response regulator [Burkholderiales bacterium]
MCSIPLQVAVVDDEASVRKALQRLLRSAGMEVETFPSGEEFLDAIPSIHPDCFVLDLHMPGVNGFDVLARLSQSPIRHSAIVITGHDTPDARERTFASGGFAYLVKPIDDHDLLGAIADATTHKRLTQPRYGQVGGDRDPRSADCLVCRNF